MVQACVVGGVGDEESAEGGVGGRPVDGSVGDREVAAG